MMTEIQEEVLRWCVKTGRAPGPAVVAAALKEIDRLRADRAELLELARVAECRLRRGPAVAEGEGR